MITVVKATKTYVDRPDGRMEGWMASLARTNRHPCPAFMCPFAGQWGGCGGTVQPIRDHYIVGCGLAARRVVAGGPLSFVPDSSYEARALLSGCGQTNQFSPIEP